MNLKDPSQTSLKPRSLSFHPLSDLSQPYSRFNFLAADTVISRDLPIQIGTLQEILPTPLISDIYIMDPHGNEADARAQN
jgi:hypothetical protein